MDSQALLDLVSSSPDPAAAIDRLAGQLNSRFVEHLNAACTRLVGKGRLEEALRLNGWALLALRHVRNPLLQAHTLFNRGEFLRGTQELEKAESAYREAVPLYENEGSPTDILDCASGLMLVMERQGQKAATHAVAQRALEKSAVLQSGEAPDDALLALRQIGHVLRHHWESRLARICFSTLLKNAQRLHDTEAEAEANGVLAEIYNGENDVEKAVQCLRRALELDRELGNWKGEIIDLANLARLLYGSGGLDESASLYASCLELRDEHGYMEGIELDLKNYLHVCHYLERRGEALALFKRYSQLVSPVGEISEWLRPVTYRIYMDERANEIEGRLVNLDSGKGIVLDLDIPKK
jgi:tetratricopeptide (TPR) repeat protein